MIVEDNVCLRYADSYRLMARTGTKTVDVWSIITDLERNMSPEVDQLMTASKVNAEDCNEAESILREIFKEWSCSGDVFGAMQKAKEFLS